MTIKVTVPNKYFNGVREGVKFAKGEAMVEDNALAKYFVSRGYTVEEIAVEPDEPVQDIQDEPEVKEIAPEPEKKAPAKKRATKKVAE
jgi:hypothetical protein